MNDKPGRRGRRPSLELTDPQRRTLTEIQDWIVRHSMPPTVQELADALRIAPASAHDQVNQLVKKGFLKREPRKARSLSVVRQATASVPAQLVSIPILGTVVAGAPLLAEENVVTMPGESFGAGGAGHLRVALTVSVEDITEACKRIARLAERI